MNRRKIKLFIIIFLIITGIIIPIRKYSHANTNDGAHFLEDLEIKVYINNDGSARIIEKRNAYLSEGTENYIVIENLGDSEIKDFKVKEGNILYEYKENWNVDDSREDKTYKNGIIKTKDGYELCWGIGEYGRHHYTVEYTVTNFVKQFKDRQGIFWRFVNDQTNIPPMHVSVTIESDKEFSYKNSSIWAFGYKGNIQFKDNKIVAENSQSFSKSDYLTILVEFKEDLFSTESKINKPFEKVKKKAFKSSDYNFNISKFFDIINEKGHYLFIIFMVLLTYWILADFFNIKVYNKLSIDNFTGKYYKDSPYNGNPEDLYYLLKEMGITKTEDLITGLLLKWINNGWVRVETIKSSRIFIDKATALKFVKEDIDKNTSEGQFYNMMLEAAGNDRCLEKYEFERWARDNYLTIYNWEKNAENESLNKLEDQGYIIIKKRPHPLLPRKKYIITDKGIELQGKIYMFMNYLKAPKSLNKDTKTKLEISNQLMVWAGLFGITKTKENNFKDLYSEFKLENKYQINDIYIASKLFDATSEALTYRHKGKGGYSSYSGSSSFSSSSNFSGGSGSFGGGSGGGTR